MFYQNLMTNYPEVIPYFPLDLINSVPKCQGIKICNHNTHVIGKENRIRFI